MTTTTNRLAALAVLAASNVALVGGFSTAAAPLHPHRTAPTGGADRGDRLPGHARPWLAVNRLRPLGTTLPGDEHDRDLDVNVDELGGAGVAAANFFEREFERCRNNNTMTFGGSVSIDSPLPNLTPEAVAGYVADPTRLLGAAWNKEMIEHVDGTVFRLKMRPLRFVTVHVNNAVLVDVNYAADGGVEISSKSVETLVRVGRQGQEKRVDLGLRLSGTLAAQPSDATHAHLAGGVGFEAQAKLIRPLAALPDRLLKPAVSALNRRILKTAGARFVAGVVRGVEGWKAP